MPSYRENAELAQQMQDLLGLYNSKTAIVEQAVARLHREHFPLRQPEPPCIVGYAPIILSAPAVCAETGAELAPGTLAYRYVWSDGRDDPDVVSRESLVVDGVLEA